MAEAQRTVYVNGQYLAAENASISIFDRGFLMADAVYEVSAVTHGRMIDNEAHLKRLERSLGELNMPMPLSREEIIAIQTRLIEENRLKEGLVYLQITRGTAERSFCFDPNLTPNVVLFTQTYDILAQKAAQQGIRVMTAPDIRWKRRDIKTTQLLAQSLAKMIAQNSGYDDAWLVDDDGTINEGTSNNAWIIKGDSIYTHPATFDILNGITRRRLIHIIKQLNLTLTERPFNARQAIRADEAFITSAGAIVTPVISIDGHTIGSGKPGVHTLALREAYFKQLCDD